MVRCDICEAIVDASTSLAVFHCSHCDRIIDFGCCVIEMTSNGQIVTDVTCDVCAGSTNPGEVYYEEIW